MCLMTLYNTLSPNTPVGNSLCRRGGQHLASGGLGSDKELAISSRFLVWTVGYKHSKPDADIILALTPYKIIE